MLWVDDRLGTAHFLRHALRKAFPDHWSFMLGEINMYVFVVLVATGTFLALFFDPNTSRAVYRGPYTLLDGVRMSHAYASALALSFEVNVGLFVRQIHHWAALDVRRRHRRAHGAHLLHRRVSQAARDQLGHRRSALLACHVRRFHRLFASRRSAQRNRAAHRGFGRAFGSGRRHVAHLFPDRRRLSNRAALPRLFVLHIYLVPAALAGLIVAHLIVVWRQKHSQFPGPGRTERNVVGSPLVPRYAAKSVSLLLAVIAVLAALGALVQINPIWLWGPYDPWRAVSPAQPDWYVGWLDGALRLGPPWVLHFWGHTMPSPFWPAVLLPGILFVLLLVWPWIDAALRNDRASHQLLDNPRDVPWRTALGVAILIFALGLTLAGSDDVQARYVHIPITTLTAFYRFFCLVGPVVGFAITYLLASELRARGGVHKAPRVRLRRNARGGFEEEPLK